MRGDRGDCESITRECGGGQVFRCRPFHLVVVVVFEFEALRARGHGPRCLANQCQSTRPNANLSSPNDNLTNSATRICAPKSPLPEHRIHDGHQTNHRCMCSQ